MPRENLNAKFEKYGLMWTPATDPLWMEMRMIQKGGRWKIASGAMVGMGLEYHFKAALKLEWPEIVFHKWTDMFIEQFLSKRTVVVIGPASSGKTKMAAFCTMLDFQCFPDETTVICCSTTRERLEDRVWGEIKSLHKAGQKRFPWLPGHLIESRQRIITNDKDEASEGRDFRNGLVGVPCFPPGTLLDTPHGKRAIESLKIGDEVFNACGVGRITETHNRSANRLVRFTLSDGRSIDCTEEHPIFTQRGWVKAIDLETFDMVFSVHETMSLLRQGHGRTLSQPEILLRKMPSVHASESVRSMRPTVSPSPSFRQKPATLLRSDVCWPLRRRQQASGIEQDEAVPTLQKKDGWSSCEPGFLFCGLPCATKYNAVPSMRESLYLDSGISREVTVEVLRFVLQEESNWETLLSSARSSNQRGNGCLETVFAEHLALSHSDRFAPERRKAPLVSTGHCVPGNKAGGRSGRRGPSDSEQGGEGCVANNPPQCAWVDSVEILESGSDPRFEKSRGGYSVHNISVDGHPSYSVNGVVVHNCKKGESYVGLSDFAGLKNKRVILLGDELSLLPRVFVDGISNLDKNTKFLCIGLGNPKDTTDALGVLAEPAAHLGGWDGGIDQSPFTKVWETRRPQGVCLQLVGSDSPNLDGKLGIPLLTQEQIDRDVAFYGTDSLWYTMMNQGMMPRGQGSRRVITRQICEKFGARNSPNWLNSNRTKIAFLDAAYRGVGGDRCVFGVLEYGEEMPSDADLPARLVTALVNQPKPENQKRKILNLEDTMLVPLSNDFKESPEDQIVAFVMKQCTERGIPPENFFYDAGMRTSLVQAFARLWAKTTNSIDCGGKPSERKVSYDIDVFCRDYYSKFITELWFNVRHVIEAGQFRGMTDDVMLEFGSREWTMVGANKIEVESKDKMKAKTGRSPDLADAVAVGIWGAIQKGFVIRRLAGDRRQRQDDRWKQQMREKSKGFWQAGQMVIQNN